MLAIYLEQFSSLPRFTFTGRNDLLKINSTTILKPEGKTEFSGNWIFLVGLSSLL